MQLNFLLTVVLCLSINAASPPHLAEEKALVVEITKNTSSDQLRERYARFLFREHRLKEALVQVNYAVQLNPKNESALALKNQILGANDKPEKSAKVKAADRQAQLDAKYHITGSPCPKTDKRELDAFLAARDHMKQYHFKDAQEVYERALAEKDSSAIRLNLISVLLKCGEYDRAAELAKTGKTNFPEEVRFKVIADELEPLDKTRNSDAKKAIATNTETVMTDLTVLSNHCVNSARH